jgi:hypothetical protein
MRATFIRISILALGIYLIVSAIQMAGATIDTSDSSSNVGVNAAIGGTVGGLGGLGTFLFVGGVGVAGAFTFGLGAVALTAIGVGVGTLAGAASGSSSTVIHSVPAYPGWMVVTAAAVGAVCCLYSLLWLKSRFFTSSAPREIVK